MKRQFIPNQFIKDISNKYTPEIITCLSFRGKQVYSGVFVFDCVKKMLSCSYIKFCTIPFSSKRCWLILGSDYYSIFNPEEKCRELCDQKRFVNFEAKLFCTLREKIRDERILAKKEHTTELNKVMYKLDGKGRYIISSKHAPIAEIFAISAALIV